MNPEHTDNKQICDCIVQNTSSEFVNFNNAFNAY